MIKIIKSSFLFLAFIAFFSCSEDEEPTVSSNTNVTIEDSNGEEVFSALGVVNEGVHPVFEMNTISFEFNENNNVNENRLLLTIDIFSEGDVELFEGLRTLSDSYVAGGELDTWGAGATVWDQSGNSTIYSKVVRGYIDISRFSDNRVSGTFLIDLISRDETQEITITGNFSNVPRESF